MKIYNHKQGTEEWVEARLGRITGTRLADVLVKRGTKEKIGFYELIAERLATKDDEDPMERGTRLQEEALKIFSERYGKVLVDVGLCVSDDNDYIACSPDALISSDDKFTEAVEIKCLSTARHLQAYFEQDIGEYEEQALQYFIVNPDLQILHFCFYDPRLTCLPFYEITIEREKVKEQIESLKQYQLALLERVNEKISQLTF